ncbi:MAG TPA: CDP-alcohol phosphatidyltransferase family protein [Candidatus Aminicenantes bacterium]|nr:CDP-alcohol phosphatidyltransferase family protein [Candidatus Aminicenantes bacterium]
MERQNRRMSHQNKMMTEEDIKKNKTGFIIVQSITLLRIPLAITFAAVLLSLSSQGMRFYISLSILLLIEATDLFDGPIARHFNLSSEYGATLDPYADSISRLIVYFAMALSGLVLLLLPLCMALRDITVAYSRILLAKKGFSVSAKKSGKIKAAFQAIGGIAALLGPYYWNLVGKWSFYFLSWTLIIVTLMSSVEYVSAALKTFKKNEKSPKR